MSHAETLVNFALFAVSLEVLKIILKHYTESFMSDNTKHLPRPLALGGEAHRWDVDAWKALGYQEQLKIWATIFGNRGATITYTDEEIRAEIREYLIYWTGKGTDPLIDAAENFLDRWTDRYGHTKVGKFFKFLGFGSK